jgi:hypothetical protein
LNLKPALRVAAATSETVVAASGMVRYIREEGIAYEQSRRVALTP